MWISGRATRVLLLWITLFWQALAAHAGPLEDCAQAQDIDRRIKGCSDHIRQFPGDATAFFNRASAYLSKGDLDRAIGDSSRVIQIDPAYATAYYQRGIAYQGMERYDLAIADFSRAVEINPRLGGVFDARAGAYLKIGQATLALRDAERAVSLDPFDKRFLDTRASIYEALGRTKEAIADYRRLLSSNPSMKSAIDGLRRLGELSPAPANAAPKAKLSAKVHLYAAPPRYRQQGAAQPRYSREEVECERAQYADPAGVYARYPCWARAAFRGRR
jgi:tetratricopeptide (TPR) repeat protein